MATLSTEVVYQLHIRLAYIEPPIWRRIVVSGQVTLFGLHRMLQVVMGWGSSLKRCGTAVIRSTRNCVHGQDSTLIQSCFPCKRSTQHWRSSDRAFFSHHLSSTRETFVFTQEQMAVLSQGFRRRFPRDAFCTGFSRRGKGSSCICGAPNLSGRTSSSSICMRVSLSAVINKVRPSCNSKSPKHTVP